VLYRADRLRRPVTGLAVSRIRRGEGWCDDPADRNYNRSVALPYPASAETLWREDHLYDVVVVLDHNRRPRVRGAGSAIFMHLAKPGLAPTAGCIALPRPAMLGLLARIGPETTIAVIGPAHSLATRPNGRRRAGRSYR
jgi:L,D-peptidoglycan transpeptidase YkuD (ErfK/YbiS/YcfS/YnhG family)